MNEKNKTAAQLKRTRVDVAAYQLRPAPWNPRPEITSESVEDLTSSIRKVGLIQPIVTIVDPDKEPVDGVDFYLVVAGHRRFKACVDAELSPIPCDVLDCDVATAKHITWLENLQRKEVNPLMEANLVAGLIADGMTQTEIAAETGRGEKWVARRANLVKLSKSWRKRFEDGEDITIDCLEHIAAYPEEIQEKCKDARGGYYSSTTTWQSIKWTFERESRDLREVLFDTAKCLGCPKNTGCCPDLFDDDGRRDARLGKCLDAKCFVERTEGAVDDAIAKAEKKGRMVVKNKQPYQCGTTKRPTKKNTALYVFTDCNGKRTMEWGEPPAKEDPDAKAKAKEERKAAKAKAHHERLVREAREEAATKFEEWIDVMKNGDGAVLCWPQWFIDTAVAELCEAISAVGSDCEKAVDAFARNTDFTASDEAADEAYKAELAKEG